jgi:putative membrane protein (TIGR04086 family)
MEKSNAVKFFSSIVKGVSTALIITLVGVLIFAGIVKIAMLNSGVIKAVNQFIKIISVFLGCTFSLKENKGLIKGVIVGVFSTVIIYLIFALVGGAVNFGLPFLLDLVMGIIVGGVSGVIAVNLKRN